MTLTPEHETAIRERECHLCGEEISDLGDHLWKRHDKQQLAHEVAALEKEREKLYASAWYFSGQVDDLTAELDRAREERRADVIRPADLLAGRVHRELDALRRPPAHVIRHPSEENPDF